MFWWVKTYRFLETAEGANLDRFKVNNSFEISIRMFNINMLGECDKFEFQVSEHILDLCVNSLNSYGINERPLFSFDAREIIPLYWISLWMKSSTSQFSIHVSATRRWMNLNPIWDFKNLKWNKKRTVSTLLESTGPKCWCLQETRYGRWVFCGSV